jgi:hypothetical protein
MKELFAMVIFVGCFNWCLAQPSIIKDIDDPYEHASFFMAGMNYLSDNVYLGRKDSVAIPYYSPYIGYRFQNGISMKATTSFTTTNMLHMDLLTLEAGYDHDFGEHFNTGVNVEKFVYNENTVSIRGNTQSCIGFDGQFSNDYVQPTATFDINFNKSTTDYVGGLAIDHDFAIAGNTLHILPTFTAFYGTQNYYDEYFTTRVTKKNKKLKVAHIINNPEQFVPLDYEISCKATWFYKNWLFTMRPIYAIPLSPSTISLPNKPPIKEKLSNTLYVELDICYRYSNKIDK